MKTIIVAVSPEGAIGLDGKIPWRHPGDMKRFKRLTTGGTVIMGRKTWESIGSKPLANRRNIVISRSDLPGVETFRELAAALATTSGEVWFIGGAAIYEEAMRYADRIDVTYVPEQITDPRAIKFPPIDLAQFDAGPLLEHEDEPGLKRREFTRRRSAV